MTLWNKIVLGCKFMFGGFEPATDYLLTLLNEFLGQGDVPERIQKARTYVSVALEYMEKYRKYCPGAWAEHYDKLMTAVKTLNDTFADNKVTVDELKKAIEDTRAAIAEWFKD